MPTTKGARRRKLPVSTEKAIAKRIESELGRDEIMAVLDAAGDDPRARSLLGLMANPLSPGMASASLYTMAQRCGISSPELIRMFRQYKIDEGMVRMSRHVPQIMEDIATDAMNRTEECWQCKGTGEVSVLTGKHVGRMSSAPCGECRGTGSITTRGDIDNRRMVLETTGLIRKGAFLNQNISLGGSAVESFESLVGRASDMLDASAEPVPALADGAPEESDG